MDSSGPSSSNAVNEGGGSQQYNPHTSQVPISNFVSIKLYGETDYLLWKEQMTCLLEYHDMVGFIDGTIKNPMDSSGTENEVEITTKYREWKKSDILVKGWIFGMLSQDVMGIVLGLHTAYEVWKKLKSTYDNSLKAVGTEILATTYISNTDQDKGSQEYPHPASLVGISSFVSIKLSGKTNYVPWEEQMLCFLGYHDKIGFIDGTIKNPRYNSDSENEEEMITKYREWKKSDMLVKGWIYGTLSKDVMDNVLGLDNAYQVWNKLKRTYNSTFEKVMGAVILTEDIGGTKDKAAAEYIPLCCAILRGDWDIAQEFFNKDKSTLTAKINLEGDSPLHLAVSTCQNLQFVENLLKEMDPASLPTLVSDNQGMNVLHRAAVVGNTEAAKMLVEKNPCLLFIADEEDDLPVLKALFNYKVKTSKLHIGLISQHDSYQNPFEAPHGSWLLLEVITHGFQS